jgi:gamma-glutamylcyclotransferase
MIRYFAYGSNMDPARITKRIGRLPATQPGSLDGYELRFNKRSKAEPPRGYANIVPWGGSVVHGVMYDVDADELLVIDRWEGVPGGHYVRQQLSIVIESGVCIDSIGYVACPDKQEEGLLPTRKYLNHLLAGRRWLPAAYFEWLAEHEVGGE